MCLATMAISKGKVGYPWESTRDVYQHIPPIYGLCNANACIGQYGVIFRERLLGYSPKGTHIFPLTIARYTMACSQKHLCLINRSQNLLGTSFRFLRQHLGEEWKLKRFENLI